MAFALLVAAALFLSPAQPRHVFVVAVNSHGAPVADLKADDLRVDVGGTPARVVKVTSAGSQASQPGRTDRLIVFLLDEPHIAPVHLGPLKQLIANIASDAGPGAAFVIRTTAGRTRLAETSDPTRVPAALDGLEAGYPKLLSYSRYRFKGDDTDTERSAGVLLVARADENAVDALRHAADLFQNDDRRHIIVWVTSGFMSDQLTTYVRNATTALLDRGAFVYGINAAASIALMREGKQEVSDEKELAYSGHFARGFDVLREIPARCGGFTLLGGDALHGGITRVTNEIANYYDVEIEAPSAIDGAAIHVTTTRPGTVLRTPERLPTSSTSNARREPS